MGTESSQGSDHRLYPSGRLIPRGDTRITEGDVLLIITSDKSKLDQIKELTEYAAS